MFKFTVSLILMIFMSNLNAQINKDLLQKKAPSEFENIFVEKLAEDNLSSTFLIWIKNRVPLHKHLEHSESVYVLEGTGLLQLADSAFEVKAGSYIFIPKNTPHSVKVTSEAPLKVLSVQSPRFDGSDKINLE